MVQVALLLDRRERVDLLLHLEHVQRGDPEDLGLAALEDRGTVDARDDLHLGVERTDVAQTTAVDADALGEDARAHDLLADRLVGGADHRRDVAVQLAGLDLGVDRRLDALLEGVVGVLTLDLVGDLVDALELVVGQLGDRVVGGVGVRREERELLNRLRGLIGERLLRLDQLGEERLRRLESLRDDGLVGLGGAAADELPAAFGGLGLDHHDRDVLVAVLVGDEAAGDGEVEDGLGELAELGEGDPLVTDEGEADAADRTVERQARDLGRSRSGVDRERVVELVGRDAEHRDDDLDLVAQAFDEGRAQRAVDQTADQDGLGRGAALATEERTGDLAGGVGTLFDIHRQREEVEAVTRLLSGARGAEDHGVFVEVGGDGALRLLCQSARLETDGAGAELAVIENGFGEFDFGTFHEVSLLIRCHDSRGGRTAEQERAGRTGRANQDRARRSSVLVNSRSAPTQCRKTTTGDQLRAGLLR